MEPMLEELGEVAAGLEFRPPTIPIVSNLTGAVVGEEMTDPAYWVRHVREPVRLADGIAALAEAGVGRFLEIGPDAVLAAPVAESLEGPGSDVRSLAHRVGPRAPDRLRPARRPRPGGVAARLPRPCPRRRRRGRLGGAASGRADRRPADLRVPAPALLAQRQRAGEPDARRSPKFRAPAVDRAATPPPRRLALRRPPRARDPSMDRRPRHLDTALVPGTAFVEMAGRRARRLGCEAVEELTLVAPSSSTRGGRSRSAQGRGAGEGAASTSPLYSNLERADAESADGPSPTGPHAGRATPSRPTPPPGESARDLATGGAEPIDVDQLYDRSTGRLTPTAPVPLVSAAWRRGKELFAEV